MQSNLIVRYWIRSLRINGKKPNNPVSPPQRPATRIDRFVGLVSLVCGLFVFWQFYGLADMELTPAQAARRGWLDKAFPWLTFLPLGLWLIWSGLRDMLRKSYPDNKPDIRVGAKVRQRSVKQPPAAPMPDGFEADMLDKLAVFEGFGIGLAGELGEQHNKQALAQKTWQDMNHWHHNEGQPLARRADYEQLLESLTEGSDWFWSDDIVMLVDQVELPPGSYAQLVQRLAGLAAPHISLEDAREVQLSRAGEPDLRRLTYQLGGEKQEITFETDFKYLNYEVLAHLDRLIFKATGGWRLVILFDVGGPVICLKDTDIAALNEATGLDFIRLSDLVDPPA